MHLENCVLNQRFFCLSMDIYILYLHRIFSVTFLQLHFVNNFSFLSEVSKVIISLQFPYYYIKSLSQRCPAFL
jgi:hypothetical protein